MNVDPLKMPEYQSNRDWYDTGPDTKLDHINGVLFTISNGLNNIMKPFFEWLEFGLTFISFLMWIAAIAFILLVIALLIIGVATGLLGIDLV